MRRSKEVSVLSHEEQWQAAGWISALRLMCYAGEITDAHEITGRQKSMVGEKVLELCVMLYNKQTDDLIPTIDAWLSPQSAGYLSTLSNLGIAENNKPVDANFHVATLLEYGTDDFSVDLRANTRFDRHEMAITDCTDFYSSDIEKAFDDGFAIAPIIKKAQFDSAFYVGLYDPKHPSLRSK